MLVGRSLIQELYYWQNTTINLLKKYLIDTCIYCSIYMYNIANNFTTRTEERSSPYSVSDDSFLKDKVEELDQKVEGILNQTQGMISSTHNKP